METKELMKTDGRVNVPAELLRAGLGLALFAENAFAGWGKSDDDPLSKKEEEMKVLFPLIATDLFGMMVFAAEPTDDLNMNQ